MEQEILDFVAGEEERQRRTVSLIASENHPSPTALRVLSSTFAMKMAVGYPGRRGSTGCELADAVERIAKDRAERLFGSEHANVQCTSGAQANFAVYFASLEPGDVVITPPKHMVDASQGGDGNISSRDYRFVSYHIDEATGQIDYDDIREKARRYRPRLIMVGASSYPRVFDFHRFRGICDDVNASLHVDAAHIAGLIAGKAHPPAFPLADYMTCSTHKTMRGPRGGGLVLCRAENAEKIDRSVTPGIQSSPVLSAVAACAVVLGEALQDTFSAYQDLVVSNARALSDTLKRDGFTLAYGGTDTHMLVLDLADTGISGETAMGLMGQVGIMSSRARLTRDTASGGSSSGLRLGTAAATTRGMSEAEMEYLGKVISRVLRAPDRPHESIELQAEVEKMATQFPLFSETWVGKVNPTERPSLR